MNILNSNFEPKYLDEIISLATEFKYSKSYPQYGLGKILGTLFFEPSTRTRWSTEAAMIRLGGQVLSMEAAFVSSSDKKGESLADTLKTASQMVDVIAVRHPSDEALQNAAIHSDVPVINAGSGDKEHPTQVLLDLFTILSHHSKLDGKKILFTGDVMCSRTINPLGHLLTKLYPDLKVIINPPDGSHPIATMTARYVYGNEVYSQLPHIDILYTTRHQSERPGLRAKSTFKMTWELAETMKPDAIIMHPLPRNEELGIDVDKNHRAVYFDQVKNGLFVRMAVLKTLLNPRNNDKK